MGSFKVDTEKTKEYIEQLNALREKNQETKKAPKSGVCSGKAYDEVKAVRKQLKRTREALDGLLDKTIQFLQMETEGFDTADRQEAASVSQKSSSH